MPTIRHFEIPADDLERARIFYQGVFEWEFKEMPMEYWSIETKKSGQPGYLGGLLKRQKKNQRIVNYIGVPSLEHYTNRVAMLGGRVIVPKRTIPGMGHFAMCSDTENNIFALWEDDDAAI